MEKRDYRLKAHPAGPLDLDAFARQLLAYRNENPENWHFNRLQHMPELREMYNAMRRISVATWGDQNRIPLVAIRLGVPFISRFTKEAIEQREEQSLDRVLHELCELHIGNDGLVHFLAPNQVKERNPGLYQRCVQHGGYSYILDSLFGEGSYALSAIKPADWLLDKKFTLDGAVDRIVDLCKKRGHYVAAIQLRDEDQGLFNDALRALRMNSKSSRKRMSYVDFFERFCLPELATSDASRRKFAPPAPLDNERMGYVGELFTYANFYIEHPNATLQPGFPRAVSDDPLLSTFRIRAPFNIRSNGEPVDYTYPDCVVLAGKRVFILETKAGLYFTDGESRTMTQKYHETMSQPLRPLESGDDTKVIWGGVHLHFPLTRMSKNALDNLLTYHKKHGRPVRIYGAQYFQGFFHREPTLGAYYAEYITNPLTFVREERNIVALEKAVLAVAPKPVQDAVTVYNKQQVQA